MLLFSYAPRTRLVRKPIQVPLAAFNVWRSLSVGLPFDYGCSAEFPQLFLNLRQPLD